MRKKNMIKIESLAYCIATCILGAAQQANARDYFPAELLEVNQPGVDQASLSTFETGGQTPGIYRVDIVLNTQIVDTREVRFFESENGEGNKTLQPCLSVSQLESYGVKTNNFPDLGKSGDCADLTAIPQASAEFEFSAQRLKLSIPQNAIAGQARGYVAPESWDEGINALMLNYSLSGDNSRQKSSGDNSSSQYANLRPGLNLGPWRIRNYTTWNRTSQGDTKWNYVYTYLQRNLPALKSQLTLGDSTTPSDVFDSVPFRGGMLASDDDMQPDSLKGYAPVVRGIAQTNAQVVIRQGGYVIYQNYVAPGAFEITDMYPTGGSGDLDVTVKEADGSQHNFVVPFASLPVLQREGRLKYALMAGNYRSYNAEVEKSPLAVLTTVYGLPAGYTLYGGVQLASLYRALAIGVGKNMGKAGALSVDATSAVSSRKESGDEQGTSWRIRYSKNFIDTGTNVTIAGYRYSTNGYYSLQEVLDEYGSSGALQTHRRNRAELTVSQSLGESLGALSVSAIRENYWHGGRTMQSYALGYSNSLWGASYSLNYSWNYGGGGASFASGYQKDQIFAFNVSVPLAGSTYANYSMNNSQKGDTSHNVGLSGTALEGKNLNWNIQQSYSDQNGMGGTSLNAGYQGRYGSMNGGYSQDKNSQRLNLGVQGGVVVHGDGVTFSQPLGETVALVSVPGISGISVQNQPGVRTDSRGYAVVSNLNPYRKNSLALSTASVPEDVELALTNKTAIPTRGAVVRAEYIASVGLRIIMRLTQQDGKPVPFGSIVSVGHQDNRTFIVGDNGDVYLTGMEAKGSLFVQWGEEGQKQCRVGYDYSTKAAERVLLQTEELCKS